MKAIGNYQKNSLLIYDHNEVYLVGLRNIVQNVEGVKNVYCACNIEEIQFLLSNYSINTMCIDIDIRDMDTKEYIQRLRYKYPNLNILILSHFLDKKLIRNLLTMGVKGFVLKSSSKPEILKAMFTVNAGNTFIDDSISSMLVDDQNDRNQQRSVIISRKCKEILFLLTHEMTIQQIANQMGLSNKTIEKHRSELFKAIGVKNMVGLALYAFETRIHSDLILQQKYHPVFSQVMNVRDNNLKKVVGD